MGMSYRPLPRYADELLRLQYIVERSNVRLRPSADEPKHWPGPETYHSGLKVKFLNHHNQNHQASIAKSFANRRFNDKRLGHLPAVDTLGDVALRVDEWTLDLVRLYGVDAREHKDADDRRAYEQEIARTLATPSAMVRRGVFRNKYRIDFRGRINAIESFNYATADTKRSLFRFAAPDEITDKGLDWLRMHAANCYGLDKLSYIERIYWVLQHEQQIEDVFYDPYGSKDFWYRAKRPFALAAACRELVLADNNPKHLTNLPLAYDHTASGFQHLALIGLDSKMAALVNLIKRERPVDVYGVLARLTELQFDGSPAALLWREFFNKHRERIRELLKTPGMTFSYAATTSGNINQILEALYDILGDVDRERFSFETIGYLVRCFRAVCAEELPGPVQSMKYIQSLVKQCYKAGRFLEFMTSSGLYTVNDYPKLNTSKIYLPDVTEYTIADGFIPGTIRKAKAVSAAAANFVHSLDATRLVRVVNAMAENEMSTLCVHDSYAVLAPHAEQFHITNRQELWAMYYEMWERGGPLALLCEQNGNIGAPPPPPGDFDIAKVQDATYACC
jgi:DNA-directed RNA polymerase